MAFSCYCLLLYLKFMKYRFIYYFVLACAVTLGACGDNHDNLNNDGVWYRVTFNFNWNEDDFPIDYPSGAHFSPLVGFSHMPIATMLSANTIATDGVRDMAERGDNEVICDDINALIAVDDAHYRAQTEDSAPAVGLVSVDVLVEELHSSVSFVTMIAPSPDWFVGVIDVSLLEDGELVDELVVEAQVYDAGTDGGVTYMSDDMSTLPREPISVFVGAPLGDGTSLHASICEVVFTKM